MATIDKILNETTVELEKPIENLAKDLKLDKFKRVVLQMIVINLQIGDEDFIKWTETIKNINELDNYINVVDKKYREVIL